MASANPTIPASTAVSCHKRKKSNSVKSFFDSLSDELVVEILLRLPMKSAHCCRCVSKRWNSLIADPYFARQYGTMSTFLVQRFHFLNCRNNPILDHKVYSISEEQPFKSRGFSFNFLKEQSPNVSIQILASCNGLVLCSDCHLYYICNPLTKQWVGFPWPSSFGKKRTNVGLICDYCNDQGLSSIATRCKVIRIPRFHGSSTTFYVEIFSSETRQWSELLLSCPRGIVWAPSQVLVCNGMFLWLSWESNVKNLNQLLTSDTPPPPLNNGIVAYNPYNKSTGQCHFIDLPKDTKFSTRITSYGVWQGHLWVSHMSSDTLSVWELEDFFTGEWFFKHKIDLSQVVSEYGLCNSRRSFTTMLPIDPNDKDVVYLKKYLDLRLVEMKSKKLKMLPFHEETSSCVCPSMVIPFVLPWRPTPVPMVRPYNVSHTAMSCHFPFFGYMY